MAVPVVSAFQIKTNSVALERPNLQFLDSNIFTDNGPKSKSLIEISGNSNTGKSLLLWQLISRLISPTYFGGKYCDVVLVNCSHKFSSQHLMRYIRRVIRDSDQTITSDECETIVEKCLESITILNCFNVSEFDLSFDKLEDLLVSNQHIAFIAVDSLDAFYWLESEKKLVRMNTYYTKCLDRLERICEIHNVCCAYTVNTNYSDLKMNLLLKDQGSSSTTKCSYKVVLNLLPNGTRTLNGQSISIDRDGLHFL